MEERKRARSGGKGAELPSPASISPHLCMFINLEAPSLHFIFPYVLYFYLPNF